METLKKFQEICLKVLERVNFSSPSSITPHAGSRTAKTLRNSLKGAFEPN